MDSKIKSKESEPKEKEEKQKEGIISQEQLKLKGKEQIERTGFTLKQFDYDKIKLDSFIIVIGKRRFGKSTWAQYILSKLWQYFRDGAYVFSRTKHNYYWQQHIPENRIYNKFEPDVVAKILEEQKRKYEKFKDGIVDEEQDIPYICVIFDDVISDKTIRHEDLLNEMVFSGRHFFIFTIICSQDCKGLPPAVRHNADLVAITYQLQERSIESLCKDYADIFEDKNTFKELLKENTQDFQMVIIDQTEAKFDESDVFFVDRVSSVSLLLFLDLILHYLILIIFHINPLYNLIF